MTELSENQTLCPAVSPPNGHGAPQSPGPPRSLPVLGGSVSRLSRRSGLLWSEALRSHPPPQAAPGVTLGAGGGRWALNDVRCFSNRLGHRLPGHCIFFFSFKDSLIYEIIAKK